MQKTTKLSPVQFDLPIELQDLRVAAYCWVSTEQEEQSSNIELQERRYTWLISENPNWKNAGIFSERTSGLNLWPPWIPQDGQVLPEKRSIWYKKIHQPIWTQYTGYVVGIADSEWLWYRSLFWRRKYLAEQIAHESALTVYCTLTQAESEDMSQGIKRGIKRGFQNGISDYAESVCFGYKQGDGGKLTINEPDRSDCQQDVQNENRQSHAWEDIKLVV